MPEMSARRRGQATGRGRFTPRPHDYGPHVEPDPRPTHTVWVTQKAADGTAEVPVSDAILAQRRRINAVAYDQAQARKRAQTDTPADG